MYAALILHKSYQGYQLDVAVFELKKIVAGKSIETNRFNVFGNRLEDITRPIFKEMFILRSGDGVKMFKTKTDIRRFLAKIKFKGKIFRSNQIHKEVKR